MSNSKTKILILGASGMLGSTLLRYFILQSDVEVFGTSRSSHSVRNLPADAQSHVKLNIDVENPDHLLRLFADLQPHVIINCVGIIKQLSGSDDPLNAIPINSLLPHRLAKLCSATGARLIHFSTDCVFSGTKGMYKEDDLADSADLYGRSKLMGEAQYSNVITLRTSLIGHELNSNNSLINWFLSQSGSVRGFRRAIFSGLPTIEISRVLRDFVLPNSGLCGLYHLSVDPINKFDLLRLVAQCYGKKIEIIPDDEPIIDRSLDSTRFRQATGFTPKPWNELVQAMHDFK
jgi:dTDP-4-dehydrorhamnose reductase